ncbi:MULTISPECIES: acyl-CoA thioesterase [Providencia]|uniref:4-hydroxybenzoyl-CoA thioesterase family protein n=1 Tax=Providencia heimbachae ATCC 35613 TaxID=1354272 RepID=A0A1B7JP69_9GAMM|nr:MULTISPECIES: thioesterase family protein [Providencia]MBP6123268.1 acyl-CoA thioesterase [Providencia sp.]MDD9338869.1 thioesterase family protein [Providencia heimbachae]NIH21459.1 acyl-CoA thioesterase [Providencia heimbachae]OAT49701.1 4-hydroxybenzoyl-CoA thioesterase family protein [Providencia heimbachae ATCC 35613]QCJ69048.1 acyl-CoA thioesterase [Providencia heimbachae]
MATHIKVHGYHIDVFQHVNNARYLEFYEADRWDWMNELDFINWALKNKIAMAAVNINVNYFQGAVLGDELTVVTRMEKFGVKSALCYQQVIRNNNGQSEVVSDAYVTFVFIDTVLNKAIAIDDELRERLESFVSNNKDFIEV